MVVGVLRVVADQWLRGYWAFAGVLWVVANQWLGGCWAVAGVLWVVANQWLGGCWAVAGVLWVVANQWLGGCWAVAGVLWVVARQLLGVCWVVSGVLVTGWLLTGPNQNRLCNIQYTTAIAFPPDLCLLFFTIYLLAVGLFFSIRWISGVSSF